MGVRNDAHTGKRVKSVAVHKLKLRRQIRLQQLVSMLLSISILILVVVCWMPTPQPAAPSVDVIGTETAVADATIRAETAPAVVSLPLVEQPPRQHVLYTFDESPASVQPWHPADWDIAVHARDGMDYTWRSLPPMMAGHGTDCSAPPATHQITKYEETVFVCRDHVMTAINAGGYGVIYLTPNQMVDFSKSEAIIRFDLSTLRTSQRDWIDLWISPYHDNLALPLQDQLPDLQGEPRNAIHIRMDGDREATFFRAAIVRDFQAQEVKSGGQDPYQKVLTADAKRRDTFELRISRTHVAFGMPQYNLWWVNTDIEDLGWDTGVVQFGHHTYTPTKSCSNCGPNTWHWDNISIQPARPFTRIPGQPRMIDEASDPIITFERPAPLHAHLRFSAFGNTIEVSFDKGASWHPAKKQAQEHDRRYQAYSYWTEVPAGVTDVQLRGQGILNYGWHAQDFAIWSLNTIPERP